MNNWVIEVKDFEEEILEGLYTLLNENGISKVKDLINLKNKQIQELTNNWNELEDILKIKKARMLNETDYSKYYLEGYETAIQTTHSSHSGVMLETAKNSIVVLCDELLDKMKEIKGKNK